MPSPKVHVHDAGSPAEVSLNWTACPTLGCAGLNVKFAVGAEAGTQPPCTVTVAVALSAWPHVLLTRTQ